MKKQNGKEKLTERTNLRLRPSQLKTLEKEAEVNGYKENLSAYIRALLFGENKVSFDLAGQIREFQFQINKISNNLKQLALDKNMFFLKDEKQQLKRQIIKINDLKTQICDHNKNKNYSVEDELRLEFLSTEIREYGINIFNSYQDYVLGLLTIEDKKLLIDMVNQIYILLKRQLEEDYGNNKIDAYETE